MAARRLRLSCVAAADPPGLWTARFLHQQAALAGAQCLSSEPLLVGGHRRHARPRPHPEAAKRLQWLAESGTTTIGWDNFEQKAVYDELLFPFGFGDGGGGPTEEMLEFTGRSTSFPGLPACRQGGGETYFDDVRRRLTADDGRRTTDDEARSTRDVLQPSDP